MKKFLNMNFVMYILIFAAFIAVALAESKDWKCGEPYNIFTKCEENNNGMPYRGSKPSEDDSCDELLGKIDVAANATSNSIKWRRSFFVAVLISLLIFVLVITPSGLPPWPQFYLVVLISFAVMYGNLNYYDYHLYNTPRNYIFESTAMIGEKIENDNC